MRRRTGLFLVSCLALRHLLFLVAHRDEQGPPVRLQDLVLYPPKVQPEPGDVPAVKSLQSFHVGFGLIAFEKVEEGDKKVPSGRRILEDALALLVLLVTGAFQGRLYTAEYRH